MNDAIEGFAAGKILNFGCITQIECLDRTIPGTAMSFREVIDHEDIETMAL